MRTVRFRAALAALMLPCLALTSGCLLGGDDSPSVDPVLATQAEEDIAEGVTEMSVEMLGSMIDVVAGVSQPSPAPFRGESVSWDPQAGVWTIAGSDAYDDPEATGTATFSFTVQFLSGGVPQQYLDDFTDQIELTSSVQNTGNYHPQEHAFDVDYDFDGGAALHVTAANGVVSATGSGSLVGSTETHIGNAAIGRQQLAGWSYTLSQDVSTPGTCPSGTIDGTVNNFAFSGTFADGVVTWTISRNGNVVRSDTESMSCGGA